MSDYEYKLTLMMLSLVRDGTEAHRFVHEFLRNPTEPGAADRLLEKIRRTFEDHIHIDAAVATCLRYIEEEFKS